MPESDAIPTAVITSGLSLLGSIVLALIERSHPGWLRRTLAKFVCCPAAKAWILPATDEVDELDAVERAESPATSEDSCVVVTPMPCTDGRCPVRIRLPTDAVMRIHGSESPVLLIHRINSEPLHRAMSAGSIVDLPALERVRAMSAGSIVDLPALERVRAMSAGSIVDMPTLGRGRAMSLESVVSGVFLEGRASPESEASGVSLDPEGSTVSLGATET